MLQSFRKRLEFYEGENKRCFKVKVFEMFQDSQEFLK